MSNEIEDAEIVIRCKDGLPTKVLTSINHGPFYVRERHPDPYLFELVRLMVRELETIYGKPHGDNPGRVDVPGQKG